VGILGLYRYNEVNGDKHGVKIQRVILL